MPPRSALLGLLVLLACQSGTSRSAKVDLDAYLSQYGQEFQRLSYESALAEWESNIHIVEGDSTNAVRTKRANEALARFVGSNDNIARIRGYLEDRDRLSPLQGRNALPGRGEARFGGRRRRGAHRRRSGADRVALWLSIPAQPEAGHGQRDR